LYLTYCWEKLTDATAWRAYYRTASSVSMAIKARMPVELSFRRRSPVGFHWRFFVSSASDTVLMQSSAQQILRAFPLLATFAGLLLAPLFLVLIACKLDNLITLSWCERARCTRDLLD
jgi:hypothetical protein